MAKITDKQFIESLKQLKAVKPNQEWASLLKSKILIENTVETKIPAQRISFMDIWSSAFAPRKLAYALSAVLLLVAGTFGLVKILPSVEAPEQTASLNQSVVLSQEVEMLNTKISELAVASREGKIENIAPAVIEVETKASKLAKNLKDNPEQDPETIKDIAVSLKTLANVPGTDLSESSDIKDLYKTVVESQINDLKEATLTDGQVEKLLEIESLSEEEKYTEALEEILLISNE
ncbi:MAG: hypothetical protein WC711_03725 [Candidatus Staskawiczbacteria bacterium]|jgi:hypothetical protein